MKMIETMIRREMFEGVKAALDAAGYGSMTVSEVEGRGLQRGVKQEYRGAEYVVDLLPKMKLEMVVPDEAVEKIIGIISASARTGKIGDGRIFVIPVEESVRVRTGESGNGSL
ncbi:MAG: P-II family nitrogen regulator [Methanoregula sp.]